VSEAVVRREGAGEVRVLTVLVLALLVGAYLSWTQKTDAVTNEKVDINDLKADRVSEVVWMTRTQTVTVARKKDDKDGYVWFDIVSGKSKRGFKGNKTTSVLFDSLAPFSAIRKLGSDMKPEQMKETKLERPDQKLIVRAAGGDKTYEVGGRTYGSRDWYVRPQGSKDVYLVASKVLQEIDFAEGKYMQRDLKTIDKKDVSGVILKAGTKERRLLQQSRLSPTDAYWTRVDTPDTKDESAGNYLRKLDGMTVMSYVEPTVLEGATKVLELTWLEEDKPKESMTLFRAGATGKEKYYVVSDATSGPVEVARSIGEQAEQDLADVLAD